MQNQADLIKLPLLLQFHLNLPAPITQARKHIHPLHICSITSSSTIITGKAGDLFPQHFALAVEFLQLDQRGALLQQLPQ